MLKHRIHGITPTPLKYQKEEVENRRLQETKFKKILNFRELEICHNQYIKYKVPRKLLNATNMIL